MSGEGAQICILKRNFNEELHDVLSLPLKLLTNPSEIELDALLGHVIFKLDGTYL